MKPKTRVFLQLFAPTGLQVVLPTRKERSGYAGYATKHDFISRMALGAQLIINQMRAWCLHATCDYIMH